MNSSYDMGQRKGEAFSRSSLLWVIATALVAIATMLTPGLALAEENALLPQGNLTLDANPEGTSVKNEAPSVSSSNNAAITSDAAASTSKTDSTATTNATTEKASNASDSNSALNNSNTSTNSEDSNQSDSELVDSTESTQPESNTVQDGNPATSSAASVDVDKSSSPVDKSSNVSELTKKKDSVVEVASQVKPSASNSRKETKTSSVTTLTSKSNAAITTQAGTITVNVYFSYDEGSGRHTTAYLDEATNKTVFDSSYRAISSSDVYYSDDGLTTFKMVSSGLDGCTVNANGFTMTTTNPRAKLPSYQNFFRNGADTSGYYYKDRRFSNTDRFASDENLLVMYTNSIDAKAKDIPDGTVMNLYLVWHPESYNDRLMRIHVSGDKTDLDYDVLYSSDDITVDNTDPSAHQIKDLWYSVPTTIPGKDDVYRYLYDAEKEYLDSKHYGKSNASIEFAGYVLDLSYLGYNYVSGPYCSYIEPTDEVPVYMLPDGYSKIFNPDTMNGYTWDDILVALFGGWTFVIDGEPAFYELVSYNDDGSYTLDMTDYQLTGQDSVMLRAVFKEVTSAPISFTVEYHNTDGNNDELSPAVTSSKTYSSASANADTLSTLGFSTPSESGYSITFAGWATTEGGTPVITSDGGSLSPLGASDGGSYVLYAIWNKTATSFKVTYHNTDASGSALSNPSPVSKAYSTTSANAETLSTLGFSAPSVSGYTYTFGGWTDASGTVLISADGGALSGIPGLAMGNDYDLFVKWDGTRDTFKVTYDKNATDASFVGTPSNPYTYYVGATSLSNRPTVNRTGYFFDGWSESGSKVVNRDGSVVSGGSIATAAKGSTHTLKAIWTPRTFTVNWWKAWSGTGTPSASDSKSTSVVYGSSSSLSGSDPYPLTAGSSTATSGTDTYQFQGWYLVVGSGNWDTPASGTNALSAADTIAAALAVPSANFTESSTAATGTLTVYAVWKKLGSFNLVFNTNYPSATGISSTSTTKSVTQGNNFAFSNVAEPTVSGYTFAGWKDVADNNVYKVGTAKDTLNNVQKQHIFNAQWNPNTVNFVLNDGATDTSINLHGKTNPSAKVEATVQASDLTSATPTRDGYDFLGWARSAAADGDASGVIIGGPSAKTYVIVPGDAPSDPTPMNLYAVWGPTKYQVWYDANPKSGDTKNSVTFKKNSSTVSSPYQYTSTAKTSDNHFDTPDIAATYGDASGDWYEFKGWSTTPLGTTPIGHNATFKELFIDPAPASAKPTSSTHNTLYAIWKAVTFDVSYATRDTNGTVSNAGPYTIDLATGTTVTTSTANPNTGYTIATPNTWTDASGNAVSVTGAGTATIAPTIDDLRALKTAGNTSYTFYANFTAGSYGYEVQAFMEDASGAYPTAYTWHWTMPGGQSLKASYGSTVRATDTLTSGTYSGKALRDLPLVDTSKWTSSIDNAKLYYFDSTNTKNVLQISSISDNTANNVLKVYFKRRTFDLTSSFKTINKTVDNSGTVTSTTTAGAPSGFTGTSASCLNGGAATAGLRWGQSISVTSPTYAGYNFSWAVTTPSSATSTAPGTSFALSAADMAAAYDANNAAPKAELTGTFDVILYTVTLTDPDSNSTHNWTRGGASNTAASALQTARTVSRQVAHDGTLGSWVPDTTDNSTYTYYFAGWYRSDDLSQTVISTSTLGGITPWTADVTYVAKWLPKVVVTYDQGDNDSFGNPKAGWSSASTSLSDIDVTSDVVGAKAPFATVVGTSALDGTKPKAAPGWEFDYWTVVGNSDPDKIGHDALYPVSKGGSASYYLTATDSVNGYPLTTSLTFIAHWKALPVTVTVNNAGPVRNNGAVNTDTVTATLPTVSKTYSTDDVLDLADYQPTTVPAGYTHVGWKDAAGNTYGTTGTFHLTKDGITLTPIFDEKTVKVSYKLATNSASKGSISGTTDDTVYAVKHNGVTAHTATSADSQGYDFVSWTDADNAAGNRVDTTTTTGVLAVADVKLLLDAAGVLTADKTYYANFKTNQYTITFSPDGTDGTTDYPNTTVATGTHSNGNNDFKVDWNTKIANPGDSVTVTVPLGFKQDGWTVTVTRTGATSSISGTSADLYGAYNYTVKDDVVLKAHFVADTGANFTVNYSYDPEGISSFSGSTPSNTVAWAGSVLPTVAGDLSPVQAGYNFEGWYAQYTAPATAGAAGTYATKVDTTDGKFGTIYNLLVAAGASAPNLVTTSPQSITIYAKWSAKTFDVIFDTFGNVADDASTTADDPNQTTIANRSAKWNDNAGTFWVDPTSGTLTRPGYTLTGWSATYTTTGSGTTQSRASVASGDAYAVLAGNAEANAPVTLHAIWTAKSYNVTYDYNDATIMGGTKTPDATGTYQWTQSRDYYNDPSGNVPSRTGWHFDGWKVSYMGRPSAGASLQTMNGTTITGHGNTTMHDLMQGHAEGLATDPVMTLTAQWTQESSYQWQDVLVHLDGTTENGTLSSSNTVAGNSSVAFTSYGTPKTSYEGYDFDNHVASNPNFTTATATSITVTAGSSMIYKVYYLERGYTIQYYKEATDLTYTDSTSDNPYTSDTVKLPTSTPTKAGYTFKGWQLVDPASGAGAIAGDITTATGAARKISDVLTTAPAAGTILKAVAKFEENKATITWKADTNGTVSPSDNSVSIDATTGTFSTGSGTTIKAVPNTNFDFEGWYANYNGPAGTVNEKVTSASPYVRLTESTPGSGIYDTIEPIKWTQTAGGTPIWSTITFTAKFVVSSSLTVTIDHYVEDATNGTWNKTTVTDRSATDGTSYTAAPMPGLPSGYTKNSSVTVPATYPAYKETGTINAAVPASLHFVLYYTADLNNVSYQYVDASGNVTTSVPATAPVLSTLSGVGSHKTGTTFTVEAKPSVTGYTFTGWYVQGDASKTDVSGTPMTMAGKDIVLVGTWEIAHYTVNFINAPSNGCTVTQQTGGYTVDYNQPVSSKVGSISATASLPDVSWHEQGSHTLVGWDKLIDGVVTGSPLGITDPLSEVVTSNVTFRARWANTYDVQYTRGDHGTFKDFTNTKTFIDWSSLPIGTVIDPGYTFTATTGHVGYNGTTEATSGHENYGNPKAADGWAFVGWGWNDGSKWNYSFADDPDIDYGVFKTGSSDVNGVAMPASLTGTETATGNITFVGFYKRMERTVVFSDKQFDASKGVGSGVESTVAWSPAANFASGTTTSYTYKTGKDVSMLPATSISREGYELVGWTPDGSATYTAGGTTTYQLPELAQGTTLYLYPVWQVKKLTINYDVATDSNGWGTVSNYSDARNLATDVIQGSTPNAGNGYVFDYWTKDSDTAHLTSAEGLATDGSNKLVPTESGHYYAHFKQKDYNLTYVADPADTTPAVTLPTTPLPANQHWTDSVNLEAASRTGYDFSGWDIYKSSDWTASGNSATPIHTGVMDGAHAISALSNGDGSATNLTLVATWKKATLGLTYHLTAPTGASSTPAWSTTDGDYPASEPATNRAAAPAAKIDHQINDVVDLRGAATAKLDGYKLVGWMDKADGSGTSYVFDAAYATAHGLTVATTLTMPGTSVDLYPIWDAKTYDVTFDPGAGVTASDVTNMPGNVTGIAWGDPVTTRDAAGDPKRTGYAFKGWTIKDKNGNVLRNTDAATGHYNAGSSNSDLYSTLAGVDTDDTASLTLVANWDQNTYTVKYQPGTTATVTGMPTSDWTGAYAGTVPTPAPTRAGYTFDGWTGDHGTNVAKTETSKGYDALAGSDSVTTVTLTAKWVANPHTLTYVKGSGDTWSTTAGDYPVSEPAANGAANPTAAIATETDAVIDLRQGSTLSQPGATLKGWTDGTNTYLLASVTTLTMPDTNVTLTPIWDVAGNYNVYFLAGDSTGATKVTASTMPGDRTNIVYATADIDAHAPTRAGYTFLGWSDDVTGTTVSAGTGLAYATLVGSDASKTTVNLTALWQANPHTLTYVKGSGDTWSTTAGDYPVSEPATNGAADPTAPIATATDAVIDLRQGSTLTQPGATLKGWTDGTNTYLLASVTTLTMPDANVTLTPIWDVAGDYAVHFHDGVTAGTTPVTTGTMPSDWTGAFLGTVPTPAPTRAGYTFGGWSSDQGASYGVAATDATKAYSALVPGSSVKLVNLTAIWTANPHTLTYVKGSSDAWSTTAGDYPASEPAANGAANPTAAIATATDASLTLRGASSLTQPGATLTGWNTKADGSGTSYALDATITMGDSDLVLYPVWNVAGDYAVHFHDGVTAGTTPVTTGTMPSDWTGAFLGTVPTPAPTRAGYTFGGWSSDQGASYGVAATDATKAYSALVPGSSVKLVNLTAVWTALTDYEVTYLVNAPAGQTYTGATVPVPANRTNITFDQNDIKQTALADADMPGFTFGGWIVSKADGTELTRVTSGYATDAVYSALAGSDATIKRLVFTAIWTGKPQNVTYVLTPGEGTWVPANIADAGASNPAAAITYHAGDSVTLRDASTVKRAGYRLVGWKDDATTPNTYIFDSSYATAHGFTRVNGFTMGTVDVVLVPIWDAKNYTVTFVDKPVSDTGTQAVTTMPTPNPWTGAYDDDVAHTAAVRTGYTFGGWDVYKTSDYTANTATAVALRHVGAGVDAYGVLAADPDIDALTLVASWTADHYTLTYVLITGEGDWVKAKITDGGAATPAAALTHDTDDQFGLRKAETVYYAGHTLLGWKDSNSPTVTPNEYRFGSDGTYTFTMPAKNVLLYPIWETNDDYTVTFDGNAPTTHVVPGTAVLNLPANQPISPARLTWEGVTSNVDTHAPLFDGWTFVGWTVYDSNNDVVASTDTTYLLGTLYQFNVLAGNVDTAARHHLKLVANWQLLPYTVTFKDGVNAGETAVTTGTMPADWTGAFDDDVNHTAPTRLGYTFGGWTVSDVTDPNNPVTLIGASDAGKPASGTTAYNGLAGSNAARRALEMTATWVKKALYNVHFLDKPATDSGATAVNMGGLTDITGMTWDQQFNAGPAPTRTGYTFDHWAVTNTTDPSDGSNTSDPTLVKAIGKATVGSYHYSDLAIDRLTGNKDDTIYHITMTAVWVANKHTLTYVRADGTSATDYTWVTRNITDSGKATPDAAMTKSVDDVIDLRGATTVTRKGYTLAGWANGTDATVAGYVAYVFANGDTGFSMPDADVTLYPLWAAKTYTVIYDANKPAGATDASQVVTGVPTPNPATGLGWNSAVDASHPSLLGYTFDGWVVKDAATTGALTGTLAKTSYTFDELALIDTTDHETLTLVANWLPAKYRLTYVDPVDASGAVLATPVQISTDDTKLWSDLVDATTDPISGTTPWYAGKTTADWQFDGWQVFDAATGTYRTLTASDDTHYGVLAALENLTLADVATANADPALVLYAKWTRRVPFVVDFVKRTATGNLVENSTTLTGLDGDDIATTWKSTVLDLGDGHAIIGYVYNRTASEPGMTGTLSAGTTLHLSLLYDPLTDYLVTYDANPGTNAAGATTATAPASQWESVDSGFAPVDSDWHYLGHKIDHWFYKGSDGAEHTFDATDGKTFADIAAIIYGTVDGTEGRDLNGDGAIEKPVTIYAAWVERNDYIVKYDDNYDPANNGIPSQFLGRPGASYFTPADRTNMTWSATGLEPTDASGTIVEPGVTGGNALYVQDGWNYSPDGGATQYAAEGKSFAEIAQAMYGTSEPTAGAIVLYARWKEINIQLTYAPVIATVDADGKFQSIAGTNAGGTVSRASETVSAVTGGTASGTELKAAGATATAANGYHFIGWRRVSDGTVIYAPGYTPTTSSAKVVPFARFAPRRAPVAGAGMGTGFNVLPDGTIDATTIFSVAQNATDGYWHGEDYQALFVENDPAILHYNKNADDATGTIADVTKPYGTLITLDSGTEDATATKADGFRRAHWKLTGWNTEADGSGTTYALSESGWVMPEGETTLYAMWEKVMGRLIYDKNAKDATGTIADVVKQGGTVITLDSGTEDTTADTTDGFHRAHYVLVGWNTKADYTGTHYDLSESGWVMPDGTTTLYAEWQKMKYEISGPEGTKVTIPEGGEGTKTTGGTTGGTTGTKIDGGYVTGGDVTKIEYGEPIPHGWIDAIPEKGKHVDHWTYVWTDEDGKKHTETADDPTKFTVKGKGIITPVFVDDPVEEPKKSNTTEGGKTDKGSKAQSASRQPGNRQAAYKGNRSDKLPQTSDETNLALPFGLMGLGALLIILAAKRRKDEEEAEA